jgi:hypothetical protein
MFGRWVGIDFYVWATGSLPVRLIYKRTKAKSFMRIGVGATPLMLRGKTSRWWISLTLSLAAGFGTLALQAQVIRIKVVDGKNGKPVANLKISFVTEVNAPPPAFLSTNEVGEVVVKEGPFTKMALFTPSLKYRACLTPTVKGQSPSSPLYSVADILSKGVSMENNCGKRRIDAVPGELIYFVRPWTFWETLTYN